MKVMRLPRIVAFTILTALSGCAITPRGDSGQLDDREVRELALLGSRQFGIVWSGQPVVGGRQRGVSAVTDGDTTLTTRAGTRVFIVSNRKGFPPSEQASFKGSDDQLKQIGISLLRAAGGREEEVGDVRVLRQFTQVGEADPTSKSVRVMPAQPSHRTLSIGRRIEGIEVLSSRLLLNVDAEGRVLFMELAWPDIGRELVARAREYGLRANDLSGQRLEGAEIESVRPVILHSPALGFYNDVTVAVQIIYRPGDAQIGKKPVRYVDLQGREVQLPRDIDLVHEAAVKRSETRR